ncbi:acyl-ACP desaturase [Streptomyces sp. NPDC057298]|uniref:acyl-ACP desaturase n=1 Tax=Streptomyces sp. NPDC057298 TaxID=3346091 RepID=UPI0036419DF8
MDRYQAPRRDVSLLRELEPVVAKAVDAHLESADDWYPHEYTPWSRGADFDGVLGGTPWEPEQGTLGKAARDGLVHNLLSEDNLPSYHRVIAELFTRDGAWGTWVNRWTVEEGRHSIAIRDYLMVTRAVDPVALENDRTAHVQNGWGMDYGDDVVASLVYVTFQELGTRVSYRNIKLQCGDAACEAMLNRIAKDENRHMLFYRTVLSAAMDLHPDRTVRAVADVAASIRAPGHGAPGYARLAQSMARSGIYSPVTHHEEVLQPIVRFLGIFDACGLRPDGEQAREELAAVLEHSAAQAARFTRIFASSTRTNPDSIH